MRRNIPKVKPEQFAEAFAIYHDALNGDIHEDISGYHLRLQEDDGEETIITFPDNPTNQARFAVKAFAGESFPAVSMRLMCLTVLLHQNKERILKQGGFPYQWIETASVAPLTYLSEFDSNDFVWPSEDSPGVSA
jgi:hypothetical protein